MEQPLKDKEDHHGMGPQIKTLYLPILRILNSQFVLTHVFFL